MNYYIRGAIPSTSSFYMIGTDYENSSYLFASIGELSPDNKTIGMYHISNFTSNSSTTRLVPISLTNQKGELYVNGYRFEQLTNGSVGLVSESPQLPDTTPTKLKLKPVHNAVMTPDVELYSGVIYNLFNSKGPVNLSVITKTEPLQIVKNLRFIPKNYFLKNTCAVADTLVNEIKFITELNANEGYTTREECSGTPNLNKESDRYCLIGEKCGSCKGVCEKQKCDYVNKNGICYMKKKVTRSRPYLIPLVFCIVFVFLFVTAMFLERK